MPKWVHPDVLDGGLNAIRNGANRQHLIRAYAAGDSYATVVGNSVGDVAMAAGDYTLGNGANSSRTLTTATGKTSNATANSGATPNLHLAFLDTSGSRVLWVTDETSDQVITSGNPIAYPSVVYTSNQPT